MVENIIWTTFPKAKILLILFLIGLANSSETKITAKFVKEFFQEKGASQIVSFGCWGNDERVRFVLALDTRVSYVNISEDLDMKNILKVNYYKLGVLLDLDCTNSDIIFHQFKQNNLPFNESYFWLIMTKDEEIPLNSLRELPLSINAEMTLALHKLDDVVLYDVYNPSHRHGGKLNVTYMGNWHNQKGVKIDLNQYKYSRRGNLNGLSLNFSVVVNHEPRPDFYTYLTTPIDRHLDNMHRFNYNLVLQLRDYYNFSMHLTRATSWGYLINGSFNGILGDMIKGIVDIGATPFMFKPERIDVCEYTVQSYFARAAIIFRHPKTNNIRNNFLKPFTEDVWWVIAITVVIYWGMIYFTKKIENKYNEKSVKQTNHPILDSAMTILAAAAQQDSLDLPRFYSSRIAFLSIFLWGSLLNQFYSASIVGLLLSEPIRFINTLEDLVNSNLEVGIEDMAYNHDLFATTTDPVVINLFHKKIAPKGKKANYMSAIEGLRKIQKGGFAFQVDVATAYKIIDETFTEEEICDLAEVPLLSGKHTATVTAKHSPFKKMVTYGLRQIIEHGTAERLKHVWQHERPSCPESYRSKPIPVALIELSPIIFLLLSGSGISALIVLLENYTQKHLLSPKKILQVEDHD